MKYPANKVREFSEIIASEAKLPVGLVEKDVWITFLLRELYSLPESKYLVFKGGTCLVKGYLGYYRFSEDIDLTWSGGKIKEHFFRKNVIEKVMAELGLEWDLHDKVKTGIAGTHSGGIMNYFLLMPKNGGGQRKLKVTVAFDEKLVFPAEKRVLNYLEVPKGRKDELLAMFGKVAEGCFSQLEMQCYSLQEIGAEKIRALLTRRLQPVRSRDVFDLIKMAAGKDISAIAPPDAIRAKLSQALKIPAYAKEYRKNTAELGKHLQQLAEQTALDPVFIEKPDIVALQAFAKELEKYLIELPLPNI